MRVVSLLVMATLPMIALAGDPGRRFPDVDQAGNPLECDLRGRVDMGWGFSLDLAPPLVGCNYEMHDTFIPLGTRSLDHVILSSGSYSVLNSMHDVESEETDLGGIEDLRTGARLFSHEATRLAGVPAVRVVIHYQHPDTGAAMVRDTIRTLTSNAQGGTPALDYRLVLTTSSERYSQDRAAFERVIGSARIVKHVP